MGPYRINVSSRGALCRVLGFRLNPRVFLQEGTPKIRDWKRARAVLESRVCRVPRGQMRGGMWYRRPHPAPSRHPVVAAALYILFLYNRALMERSAVRFGMLNCLEVW